MILKIYDYLSTHRKVRWTVALAVTALLVVLTLRLSYKEDISDFLPLDNEDRTHLAVFQDISGADQIVIMFGAKDGGKADADSICRAVDVFCRKLAECDTAGWTKAMTAQVDMERVEQVQQYVYENIPYFLTAADYARMDSLLSQPGYADRQLQADREMLMFPSGGLLTTNISRDPLNLFTPVVERLQQAQPAAGFENYDGYIFTPDMERGIVTLRSPFGNAETDNNSKLVELLQEAAADMQSQCGGVEARITGGPQIAVGNARQIKADSILAVGLSALLIMGLLVWYFRSARSILSIAVSILWGWIFALGMLSLFRDSVSIIVVGMASVILGIAVNYPLHLVTHARHEGSMRQTLRDISSPLLIGNITTVGAFMALIPLNSTALRDLGLFASLLLVGTIMFVLLILPHHVKPQGRPQKAPDTPCERRSRWDVNMKWLAAVLVVVTAVMAWFAKDTEFDPNMANINYMTDEQREDMRYLQGLAAEKGDEKTLYVTATAADIDKALDKAQLIDCAEAMAVKTFLPSKAEQTDRLKAWRDFRERHPEVLAAGIEDAAVRNGFAADAFSDFEDIVNGDYKVKPYGHFEPLTATLLRGNVSIDSAANRYTVVVPVKVAEKDMAQMKQRYKESFDVESMNSAMANTLSDNFNYIGIVCSAIVFLFLWLSFRNFWVAVIAFVPMAVSWIWILGIMAILGIKFNIVNIILATFIFGQGDDYTIFITEGCLHERRTGKPILATYRTGILLSAAIMLVGIGTLITARHPALHSLAEVTIVGMACVVLMAMVIPPMLFRLVKRIRLKE